MLRLRQHGFPKTATIVIICITYGFLVVTMVKGIESLMDYCLADAKENGKSGICMLRSKKQKAWLTDQSFVKKYGFEVVDTTDSG